jgi:hypothetical protein
MLIPRVRSILLMIIIFVIPGILALNTAEEAEGALDLGISIQMDQQEQNVDVDPQRGGIITYTGRVDITQKFRDLDFQFAMISLNATCTAGWEVTDIPVYTVSRVGIDEPEFSVSVFVPQLTTATGKSEVHEVIISGTWWYEPEIEGLTSSGEIPATSTFLYVNQVYQYQIRSEPGYIQTAPGGQFDLDLIIENTGNGDDEIEVVIERRARMEDNGWAFIMDRTHYELPRGGTQKVNIKVTTPNRWDGWRNVISVIRFRVTSSQASQNNDVSQEVYYSVYVRQRGVSVPGFEAPLMLAAVILASALTLRRRR